MAPIKMLVQIILSQNLVSEPLKDKRYRQINAGRQSLCLAASLFAVKVKKGKRSMALISNTGLRLAAMGLSTNPVNQSVR